MDEFLMNCSNTELKELYQQILRLNKTGATDEQPLRQFIDETINGLFVVPFHVYAEISKRWYEEIEYRKDWNIR